MDAGHVGTWAEVELEAATEGLEESPGEAGVVLPILLLSLRLLQGFGRWALRKASCSWRLRRIMGSK